jgi:hypothetical protein
MITADGRFERHPSRAGRRAATIVSASTQLKPEKPVRATGKSRGKVLFTTRCLGFLGDPVSSGTPLVESAAVGVFRIQRLGDASRPVDCGTRSG